MLAGLLAATVTGYSQSPMNRYAHEHQQRYLLSTDQDPPLDRVHAVAALEPIGGAEGWGRVMVTDQVMPDEEIRRALVVRVLGLEPETEYTAVIDGLTVGALTTDAFGDGRLHLGWPEDRFPPVPDELPPAEALELAQIVDASLAIVLEGEFVIDWSGGSGPADTVYMERIRLDAVLGFGERGIAKVVRTDTDEQIFETRACGLEPGAVYQIVVDGFLAGAVTADVVGHGSLELTTADGSLPADLQPIEELRVVEWVDAAGGVVLTGTFTGTNMAGNGNGGGQGGGGGEPGGGGAGGGNGDPGGNGGGNGDPGGNGGGNGGGGTP